MHSTAIVAGLHLRWDGVWQRPHHILSRLARRVPVIVIEEPFVIPGEDRDEIRRYDDVTVVRPVRAPLADGPYVDGRAIATARSLLGGADPIVWLYQPLMLALGDAFAGAPIVYDCMDDLASFAFAPARMPECEAALLRRAELVFCGGRTLFERLRGRGRNVKLYPSGVEFERFAAARRVEPHRLARALAQPRYGYVGVIDERLDYELIGALSRAPEKPNVIMVGPVMKIDCAVLPRRPNVHFTGKLPYGVLPSILSGFDVALMPFALNDSTRAISPAKTLEYLAAGIPVVSTPIPDVLAAYREVVTIAEARDFVPACAVALRDRSAVARGVEIARAHDWDAIVGRMWADVVQFCAAASRSAAIRDLSDG
jgi:UDP-galactopyranose mutase